MPKGWFGERGRHSLAARGIKTARRGPPQGVSIRKKPFTGYEAFGEKTGRGMAGGWVTVVRGGKEIGRADFSLHHQDVEYPLGYVVPKGTAYMTDIELYYKKDRGKGIGSWLLRFLEEEAKKQGMSRMWVGHVQNEKFFRSRGYKHTGIARIWEKEV